MLQLSLARIKNNLITFASLSMLALTLASSCGPSSNINRVLFAVPTSAEQTYDALLLAARLAYDEGNYEEAKSHLAGSSTSLDGQSEEARQLMGYVNLAAVGVDALAIVRTIATAQAQDAEAARLRAACDCPSCPPSNNLASELKASNMLHPFELTATSTSSTSLNIFDLLGTFISLKQVDFAAMGTLDNTSNAFFSNLPIYLPRLPGNHTIAGEPRNLVATLKAANEVIAAMCPFMPQALLTVSSHERYECTPWPLPIERPAQNYFLFGIAHLVEALAFNLFLLYRSDSAALALDTTASSLPLAGTTTTSRESTSHLFLRVASLQKAPKNFSQLGAYSKAVVELKNHIDQLFDTREGSMLYETLVDIQQAVDGFAAISGLPTEITAKLRETLEKIRTTASKAHTGIDNSDKSLTAASGGLKQELTSKIVTQLNTSMGTYIQGVDTSKLSEQEKTNIKDMCGAVTSLIADTPGATLPPECNAVL